MSFRLQRGQKDSGISWVGDIPSSWQVKRAKYLFTLGRREPKKDEGIVTAFRDGQVTLRSNRRTEGFTNAEKEIGYQGVRRGDLVIHAMDAFAGAIGVSDSDGKCSPVYSCCVPTSEATSEFYAYCVRTMATTGYIQSLAKGIRERSTDFRWATFAEQFLPVPPRKEQERIGAFIMGETARIDRLIARKARFIELLTEKRQALITHVVTKGLDPNAKMKHSGVEWLGDVPEHWSACPIKYVGRIGNGSTPNRDNPHYWSEFGFPWLNSSVVNQEEVSEAQQFVTDLALRECHLPIVDPPAVLVGITGQGKTRGMAAPLVFKATINQHLAFIRPEQARISVEFLLRALQMAYPHLRLDSEGAGSTKGAITCEQLGNFPIPLPPRLEQQRIVRFLDESTNRIGTLVVKTERSIELLREHRTALITAAVTGKISLREAA